MVKSERKKILIVNVNWVGDVLFSTPFIRALREAYPESHIACLLHPRCTEMLSGNPRIDEIIIYDEEGRHKGLWGKWSLIALIAAKGFDTAFVLHRSFTKAFITYLAGIKERIGYSTKRRGFILTRPVDEPRGDVHKVEYFLDLARASGVPAGDPSYEFYISDADRDRVGALLGAEGLLEKDPLVVICPGGNWGPKRWPAQKYALLSDLLAERLGAKIAIAGAAKDAGLAEYIKGAMKKRPIVTCGKTTLKELGALLERSDLVVANDTGPMHIAVAMKAKVIALFGPTSPRLTGPYGKGEYRVVMKQEECVAPCYDDSCADNRCMDAIQVEDVMEAAKEMLGAQRL